MGFATHFSDFSGSKSCVFTFSNSNKHPLTPLLQILNDLEMLTNSHLLTAGVRLIGKKNN